MAATAQTTTSPTATTPPGRAAWAPDYAQVARARRRRFDRLLKNATKGQGRLLAGVRAYYRDHPVAFIEDWFITYDPRRERDKFVPFLLFPRQRELVEWLHVRLRHQEDGLIEKSRDVGLSWVTMAFACWMWLFVPGCAIGFGSYKANKVDLMGDPDSLLEKGRILLKNVPYLFWPEGFTPDRDLMYMKFINPETGSTITGESGDQIGRGGRKTIYFKDEAAFFERPERAEAALSNTSNCKIDLSTVNGMGNPFYVKRHSGRVPVFVFDWRDDPRKDNAWYRQKCVELEPEIVAQEIDRDYSASVSGVCIPGKWVQACVELAGWLPVERVGEGVAGLDVGAGGGGKSILVPRWGPVVGMPSDVGDSDTTETAKEAVRCTEVHGVPTLNYDSVGVGRGVESTLKHSALRAHGINVGEAASNELWPDGKRACEKFANWKAELWYKMRERARKSYELLRHLQGHTEEAHLHPIDECMVLPLCPKLLGQLPTVKRGQNASGKITIESKDQLRGRGIRSPDYADALVLTEAESRYEFHEGNFAV